VGGWGKSAFLAESWGTEKQEEMKGETPAGTAYLFPFSPLNLRLPIGSSQAGPNTAEQSSLPQFSDVPALLSPFGLAPPLSPFGLAPC